VITTVSMPPTYRRSPVIQGPCVFGHKTTSSQGKYGVAVWHQIPDGKTWRGAVAKDALCSACFQKMKRSNNLEDSAINCDKDDMNVDEYFESIRKRAKLAILNESNNYKKPLGADPVDPSSSSSSASASSTLTVIKQSFDNKRNNEPTSFDTVAHNNCEVSFSAKRSQHQARLVCGIFDGTNKKTPVNTGLVNSFQTSTDNSQLHQGFAASGSLGADEGPKLDSKQRTPNEDDTITLPCTGPKSEVNRLPGAPDEQSILQANARSSENLCKKYYY